MSREWCSSYQRLGRKVSRPVPCSQKDLLGEIDLQKAQEEFEGDDIEVAIQKYAYKHRTFGVYFHDTLGELCTWEEDLNYSHPGLWKRETKKIRLGDRHYYVMKKSPTLAQIDQPNPRAIQKLVAHHSELGWKLPLSHKRHIMNFPREIIDYIFELALTAADNLSIQPFTGKSNWVTYGKEPDYQIRHSPWIQSEEGVGHGYLYHCHNNQRDEDPAIPLLVRIAHQDKHGHYTELRAIIRRSIDASFLRASKAVYSIGARLLYGNNPFIFAMTNPDGHASPPTAMLDEDITNVQSIPLAQRYFDYQPGSYRPHSLMEDSQGEIRDAIWHIKARSHLTELHGWAYHDTFLRFLHTIGPKNAAKLKTLKFNGTVKIHSCELQCRKCPEDLVSSLRIYVPFIKELCTGVEKLVIYAEKDYIFASHPQVDPESLKDWEHALLPLLENEIRQISSLKVLEVYCERDNSQVAGFAIPTATFFRERTARRYREALEHHILERFEDRKLAQQIQMENARCGFCGEDHVWVDCHNLCNFCGRFGHFREACSAIPVTDWELTEPN